MGEISEVVAAPEPGTVGPVVAKAGRYYRVARVLMTILLLGYGVWSIYDGFISWPKWTITHPEEEPKTRTDILLNQVLGIALPPLGLGVLIWAIYNSRGEYRLENGVLHVPGHPAVPLDKIQSVNRELWDRKGIAYVTYDLTEAPAPVPRAKAGAPIAYRAVGKGARGMLRLDDFVYDRAPVDQIFKAIEASLLKHAVPKPAAPPPAAKTPPRPKKAPGAQ
jgi:hypothetical protein